METSRDTWYEKYWEVKGRLEMMTLSSISLSNSEYPTEVLQTVNGDCISQGSSEKQNQ